MERRTPVFIICSPLPQVGKTLVARLLIEFFRANDRPAAAFDLNPGDYSLADQLPDCTTIVNLNDIQDQMALFDQLIVADQAPKVVDLGYVCFEPFFSVMREIGFEAEARRGSIAPVLLFLADPGHRSTQAYAALQARFPEYPLVPILNMGTAASEHSRTFTVQHAVAPLRIPALAPVLRASIQRAGFSFAAFNSRAGNATSELSAWTRSIFLQFRELELRLLLEELKPALQLRA
jgi:hypothetical protein